MEAPLRRSSRELAAAGCTHSCFFGAQKGRGRACWPDTLVPGCIDSDCSTSKQLKHLRKALAEIFKIIPRSSQVVTSSQDVCTIHAYFSTILPSSASSPNLTECSSVCKISSIFHGFFRSRRVVKGFFPPVLEQDPPTELTVYNIPEKSEKT